MPSKLVKVELGPEGNVIRIFRKDKAWLSCPEDRLGVLPRAMAVKQIREQVYRRAHRFNGGLPSAFCERCGRSISWTTMEMHETVPKGKGGEVSLENCEALCHQCHTGSSDSAHGNRRWQSSKLNSTSGTP